MDKQFTFRSASVFPFGLKLHVKVLLNPILYILLLSIMSIGCSRTDLIETCIPGHQKRILIDASHDGGVWWFPQSPNTGYSDDAHHQGKALADLLRSKGFIVDELHSNTLITYTMLQHYDKVIRAGSYGIYQESEIAAYEKFLTGHSSLFLISEYKRPGETDLLAKRIGVEFEGSYYGNVNRYATHSITTGATPFYYNAGSIVTNENSNPNIQVLAWLDNNTSLPVAGILNHLTSKIFFLGEINGLETIPQPLTNNILNWLFN